MSLEYASGRLPLLGPSQNIYDVCPHRCLPRSEYKQWREDQLYGKRQLLLLGAATISEKLLSRMGSPDVIRFVRNPDCGQGNMELDKLHGKARGLAIPRHETCFFDVSLLERLHVHPFACAIFLDNHPSLSFP